MGSSMREKKESLRAAALAQRGSLPRSEALARSRLIQARALQFPPYLMRPLVALYSPIQNEVETGEIRDHALVTAKSVFFPRFGIKSSLEFIQIGSSMELSKGRFGLLEPIGETRLSASAREKLIVFVPGVAFDSHGHRLGRGTGGYDRLIKELAGATLVALAYDFQVVEEVPTDAWDQKVHYVITERSVVDCRSTPMQSSQVS